MIKQRRPQHPEDSELWRDNWVCAEHPATAKVGPKALEHDDIRGNDEEGLSVVLPAFSHSIEVLPGDRQGHDLRLPAPSGHLHRIASELVILKNVDPRYLRESLYQIPMATNTLDLIKPNNGLQSLPLGVVVAEGLPTRLPVV